jgi:hypothetical protein
MKPFYKITTLTLMLCVVSGFAFSQSTAVKPKPATATQNLVRGVVGPVGSNNSWANYTVMNIIPGSGLFPITSSTSVFYWGFTAGTEADIGNMVVYTTARGSAVITAVTPVTLGGVSDPSIILSNTSVCPVAPSTTTPCIVRFDPTAITFSPANDYYLMVYYTNDTNNSGLGGAQAGNLQSSLSSNYFGSTDYTRLTAGQSVPGTGDRGPVFLMYVMND